MTARHPSLVIGVISDTHGLLRPEAVSALRGCALILHAGDVGKPEVLTALEAVAPVRAVRGNVDRGEWAAALPTTDMVPVGDQFVYLLHDLATLDLDPAAAGCKAVIYGHSHQPSASEKKGVLYLNPGSAGPRRFNLPVALARLTLLDGTFYPEIVPLD